MIEHDLAKGSDICFVCGCIGVESRDAFNCSTFNICPCVHGDVELTHLRQDNMTLLFQAVRTWRVLSSLVDAERRGRQAGSRGVKLTWRSLGQISLALTPCCGAEFGYEDYTLESTRRYRAAWLASGATWRDSEAKPAKWDVDTQLANIPPEHQ